MGIVGWLVLGLVAGAIAKAIHRGEEPGGLLGTLAVGIVGALLGGFIASALGVGAIGSFFSLGTWLIAIGGALLLLVIYGAIVGRRGDQITRPAQ
ncbi:MAG: GlsB/YeaQ/YmgE family stress response membrane protein [Solirubrobacteraceae bacterium]